MALYATGDGLFGFLATFTDITDAKRAEAERERLLAAEQAARVLSWIRALRTERP